MIYVVVLAIVVGTLCGVTIIKTRSVKNQADFLVAGRKVAVAGAGVHAAYRPGSARAAFLPERKMRTGTDSLRYGKGPEDGWG